MEQSSIPVTPCGKPAGSGSGTKRVKVASVTTKKGVWNPSRRDFSKKNYARTPSQKQLCQAMSTPVIAAEIGATKAANVNEPDVSPVTQYCVSSDGSDAMFLGSALDAFESGAALEGSGDSAILSVPIHRYPTPSFGSEASETTTSCDSSGGAVPLLDLKRKLDDSKLLTSSKIS